MNDPQSPKILIVDDFEANFDILIMSLPEHIVPLVASNGERALEIARRELPSLILLDVVMPGMSGYQVCERLKADPATRDIPVIFITALSEDHEEAKGLALGAIDYITKPFNSALVRARVTNHLSLLHAHQQIADQRDRIQADYLKLQETEAMRDSLVHMVVHDMRSPLMGLDCGLEALRYDRNNQLTANGEKFLETAIESSKRLIGMVTSLLDVSRLEAGAMPVQIEAHDLWSLLEDGIRQIPAYRLNTRLRWNKGPEPLRVHCDREMTPRIISNFLGNAAKFSPADKDIHLDAVATEGICRISVRDQGPGVPLESRQRIFEKFAQLDSGGAARKHSTGLGLTFCKLAVEAMGGRIGVDGEPGQGSTFWFEIPLAPPAA